MSPSFCLKRQLLFLIWRHKGADCDTGQPSGGALASLAPEMSPFLLPPDGRLGVTVFSPPITCS